MTDRTFSVLDIFDIANRQTVCRHSVNDIMELPVNDPARTELLETVLSMFCDLSKELAELARWADVNACDLLNMYDYELTPKARAERRERLKTLESAGNVKGGAAQ